jgi:hypothetical protein
MTDKNLDIAFYIPSELNNLDDSQQQWLTNFKYILEVSLNQVLKRKVLGKLFYSGDKIENALIYIQCLVHNDLKKESLLQHILKDEVQIVQIIGNHSLVEKLASESAHKSYDFYDIQSGKIIDLTSHINKISNSTWLKVSDLSFEIGKFLKKNKTKKASKKDKIFFAETSPDQAHNRNYLVREFKHQGYNVIPDSKLSNDMMEFSDQVQNYMEESILSVHLLGNQYAPLLKNIEISKVELQNDIFSEVISSNDAEKAKLKRLVLIPPNLKARSEKQRNYIESFKRNIELHKNTEIIQTPLEDFKTIIQKRIDFELTDGKKVVEEVVKDEFIYIINDNSDNTKLNELKAEFKKQNIDFVEPQLSRNKIELIKQHQKNLALCSGVIISYGSNNEQWLNSKLTDIIKSPGVGRKKPFLFKAIFTNQKLKSNNSLNVKDLITLDSNDKKYINIVLDKINNYGS